MISRVEEIDEGGIWESGRGNEKVKGLVGLWEGLMGVTAVCAPPSNLTQSPRNR
jgi:hypothetical protein